MLDIMEKIPPVYMHWEQSFQRPRLFFSQNKKYIFFFSLSNISRIPQQKY